MKAVHILVTGSGGFVGSSLVRTISADGISVLPLLRRDPAPGEAALRWNPSAPDPLPGAARLFAEQYPLDAAIHLSGAPVAAHRWTPAYKQEIFESRVRSTRALSTLLARLNPLPRVLVCASGVGIYGDRGNEVLGEDAVSGHGFLAEVCRQWEQATLPAENAGIRVVHARLGMVLSPDGGALARLLPLFRLGLGGRLGSGRQWTSWVTLADAVAAVRRALADGSLRGAINVTAPSPVTNAAFTRALGSALRRPAIAAAPAFALRLGLGEIAGEALLASQRAVPARLLAAGFRFRNPEIEAALRSLLAR